MPTEEEIAQQEQQDLAAQQSAEGGNEGAEGTEGGEGGGQQEPTAEEIANTERVDALLERGNAEDAEFTEEELTFLKEQGVDVVSDDDNSNFFDEVETLTGTNLEVDYGDIDPNSAQGVVKYLDAHKANVEASFEQMIKEKAPLAYQAMLIENQGGNPADYFIPNPEDTTDYSKQAISKDNIEAVKGFIRKDFVNKGMDLETVNTLIDSLEDKGKLLDAGQTSLDSLTSLQKEARAKVIEDNNAAKAQQDSLISDFSSSIGDEIKKGIAGQFNIPQADAQGFEDFVHQRMIFQDGTFYSSKEITKEDLSKELGSLFFEFKGGNLDSLVKSRVKSEKVRTLKIKGAAERGKVLGDKDNTSKGYIPFGDL